VLLLVQDSEILPIWIMYSMCLSWVRLCAFWAGIRDCNGNNPARAWIRGPGAQLFLCCQCQWLLSHWVSWVLTSFSLKWGQWMKTFLRYICKNFQDKSVKMQLGLVEWLKQQSTCLARVRPEFKPQNTNLHKTNEQKSTQHVRLPTLLDHPLYSSSLL
jgi:hypothetical protein